MQGIVSIAMSGTEALAEFTMPVNQLCQAESTVASFCESVIMDSFIQVVVMLINTSDMVNNNEVMVCSKIEHSVVGQHCDMTNQKNWTVYAAFDSIKQSLAIGDVFVFAQGGPLVATFRGCQFTRLEICRLESVLRTVNEVGESSKTETQRPQIIRFDSLPALSTGSITSWDPSDPPSPIAVDTLLEILTKFAGGSASTVSDKTDLADMGIDSLAAVELASELERSSRMTISGADLVNMTVGQLRDQMLDSRYA